MANKGQRNHVVIAWSVGARCRYINHRNEYLLRKRKLFICTSTASSDAGRTFCRADLVDRPAGTIGGGTEQRPVYQGHVLRFSRRYAENYHPVTGRLLVTAGDGSSLELDVDTGDDGTVNIVISDHMGSSGFMEEWSTWANGFE